jgi:O-antigen ligase
MSSIVQSDARSRMNLVLLCLFVAILFGFGGASRADVLSQAVVRLAAICVIALSVLQLDREKWMGIRLPICFLVAATVVIAVQLIPLPPGVWYSLPGRQTYDQAFALGGVAPVWRPLSLTPDLTLNSLLALLPPFAMALALGVIDRRQWSLLVPVLIAGAGASALIGIFQISSGSLYFYQITNEGSPVGFFANRNHQALLLAAMLPVLGAWGALPHRDPAYQRMRRWMAMCIAAPILPILLITGSRGGLFAGLSGAVVALALTLRENRRSQRVGSALRGRLLALAPLAVGAMAIVAVYLLSRDLAFQRLFEDDTTGVRSTLHPLYFQMIRDFWPFGSGYGSFDTVFRIYEPQSQLGPTYLNHAHDDFAEVLIEGGVLPLLLLAVFVLWLGVRTWQLWASRLESNEQLLGRAGAAVAWMILLGSAIDYPVRTPLLALLITIACYWVLDGTPRRVYKSP